jgi:hypothetical protein
MSVFCKILHADNSKPVVVATFVLDVYVWESEYNQFVVFGV